MRTARVNKRTLYYANFIRKEEVKDSFGNQLSWTPIYGNPVKHMANVSAGRGEANTRIFGEHIEYSRVVLFPNPCPVDEVSIIWFDHLPVLDENGETTTPHDYVVSAVADSINYSNVAIRKVDVS